MASEIDADKLAAFEALLLKDLERRFNEKLAKGECIVTGVPRRGDAPDGAAVIITGVPRAGRDEGDGGETPHGDVSKTVDSHRPQVADFRARQQVSEMIRAVEAPQPSTPPPTPSSIKSSPAQGPYRIHVQVRAPDPDKGDPGEIAEGTYTISSGGTVRVYDADRNLLGTEHLHPGADAGAAARRVLRTKKAPDEFLSRSLH
jgi:hypothetical protein